jgi:NAD(P)H dehydrogenase (quinone)
MKAAGVDEGTAGFVSSLDRNISEGALGETTGHLSQLIGRATTPVKDTVRKVLGRD